MAIKNKDFVTIDYVGKVDGKIFDLTNEEIAKKENIYNEKVKYKPVTIVVGAGHVLKGIDEALVGKNVGDSFSIEIPPEKAFGRKNPKLIKIIPASTFKEHNINPYPGLQVNIDGLLGTIISASSGRIIVDFNHPLAGKILNYDIKILKKIDDKKAQLEAIIQMYTDTTPEEIKITENTAQIVMKKPEERVVKQIEKEAKEFIGIENIEFVENKSLLIKK